MTTTLLHSPWLINRTTKMSACCKYVRQIQSSGIIGSVSKQTQDTDESASTVDQADVDRHTKLLKEWWHPTGPMKALHTYNLIRVPFIRDGLVPYELQEKSATPLKDVSILDVGCGGGILSEPLARLGAKVTGLDASKELIECACEHSRLDPKLNDNRPNYICSTIEEHATTNEDHYDGVVASEIIEHVQNKELFVKSCIQVLKPGGRIFFTTPNRTKLAQLSVIYASEYVFKVVPKGTHQIEKFISPTELTFLVERNNSHVEIINGIFYNPLTNRWKWVDFQSFVYALQAVKLKSWIKSS